MLLLSQFIISIKDCRVSIMEGDDYHQDISEEIKVNNEFSHLTGEEFISKCKNYIRTLWWINENKEI